MAHPGSKQTKAGVKKKGPPSCYTEELAHKICSQIASGKSLRRICLEEGMPSKAVVLSWALDSDHPFSDQYAKARRLQAEGFIDDASDIADDGSNDFYENEDGREVPDHEHINRSRLRVDTRKWIACKVLPKIYGDKLQVNNDGQGALLGAAAEALVALALNVAQSSRLGSQMNKQNLITNGDTDTE